MIQINLIVVSIPEHVVWGDRGVLVVETREGQFFVGVGSLYCVNRGTGRSCTR